MATVLTGDSRDRAFERMYERYVKDVYRYALAVLRNPADAEDVTQTTFMNAYRAYKEGEDPLKPQHWLIKIAHNACRTRAIRASRRPREVPLDDSIRELAVPEQERPNIRNVLGALGRLPFNQRSALVMRELEGRSYEEIAEALGVSVSAVETLIFRARRSLRMRRDALRGLAAVPLPASLQTFGSSAVTTGGYALGSGVAVKAAAILAALIAGGASYEAVDKMTAHEKRSQPATPIVIAGMSEFRTGHAVSLLERVEKRAGAAAQRTVPRQRHDRRVTISTVPAPPELTGHGRAEDAAGAGAAPAGGLPGPVLGPVSGAAKAVPQQPLSGVPTTSIAALPAVSVPTLPPVPPPPPVVPPAPPLPVPTPAAPPPPATPPLP
jgi:RNA polymerase sigma factor (sigma-70 family)